MGKYAAYPAYKDTGVEWLGEIPEYWQVLKLKQNTTIVGRIGFRGYTQADIVAPGEGALALSPSNIRNGAVDYSVKTYISWEKYEESPEIKVFENDIVFVKTGSTIGKTAIVKAVSEPMTLNPQVVVLKNTQCDPNFLSYAMNAEYFQYQVYGYRFGGSTPAMTQESLARIITILPSNRDEQDAIARFLDHKTAQIEGLIIPRWLLEVNTQPEVGNEAYDEGARQLSDFFAQQLKPYLAETSLDPLGRQIIECALDGGSLSDFEGFMHGIR